MDEERLVCIGQSIEKAIVLYSNGENDPASEVISPIITELEEYFGHSFQQSSREELWAPFVKIYNAYYSENLIDENDDDLKKKFLTRSDSYGENATDPDILKGIIFDSVINYERIGVQFGLTVTNVMSEFLKNLNDWLVKDI